MMLWNIMFIISLVIFVISFVLLIIFRFRKNYYFRDYQDQDLMKVSIEGGVKNHYYLTDVDTAKYIKRYALRKSRYDKALICNYANPFKYISYYVVCYSKGKKIINVLEVTEENTNNSSKIINLNKGTDIVNIYIKKAENVELNTNVIRTLSKSKIRAFVALSSVSVFTFLFCIRHLLIVLIARNKALPYMEDIFNYISIIAIFVITILYFALTYFFMKKRNCENRNGGALEYEFF